MRIKIMFLCLVIAACNQTKKDVAVSQVRADSFIRQMNQEVERYRVSHLPDSADNYINQLEDTVRKVNNDRLTFRWRLHKMQSYTHQKRYDSATVLVNLALPFLANKNISYKDSFYLYLLYQDLLSKQKFVDSALLAGNELYYISKRNDDYRMAIVCYELCNLYGKAGDDENLRKYALEGLNHVDDEPELIGDLARILLMYFEKKNYVSAKKDNVDSAHYYFQILQKNPETRIRKPAALATLRQIEGQYLIDKGRYDEGIRLIIETKNLWKSAGGKAGMQYNNIADAYLRAGQYKVGLQYIDTALLLDESENNYHGLSTDWYTKSELLFKLSQYKEAYSALDSSYSYYTTEMDSSFRERGRELETRYKVREKDAEIKSLAVMNAANVKIRNQQGIIILTLVVAGLLAAIVGILLWRRRQYQIRVREADLRQQLLRTQMEPHFLFNMLSLLQGLIRNNDNERSVAFLTKFSRLLRLVLENAGKSFVPLEDEIAALESYLDLQIMFYEGNFEYDISVDDSIDEDDILIPPMLLQPFAENAILHGFKGSTQKKKLSITIEKRNGILYCVINDNGTGLTTQEQMIRTRFHATEITEERLAILGRQTGKHTGLRIIDKRSKNEGDGVRVEMEVPLLNNN